MLVGSSGAACWRVAVLGPSRVLVDSATVWHVLVSHAINSLKYGHFKHGPDSGHSSSNLFLHVLVSRVIYMSVGRPNGNEFISPETYVNNQVKIEQARKLLEDMERKNEIGLQNFTERERQQQAAQMHLLKQKEDLQRKIQEGLEAQSVLYFAMRQQRVLTLPLG